MRGITASCIVSLEGAQRSVLALAVLLSIAGLAIGPALVALGRGRATSSAAVEGLTFGIVPALVIVRLVPHVYSGIGPVAIALVAAGYVGLLLADRWGHRAGVRIGRVVVVPALAVHAVTDGAGLAVAAASVHGGHQAGGLLFAALLLHRLPEGLFLATTLVPELGWRRTLWRLGLVAGATVFGAFAGAMLLAHIPDAVFDAVVAVGLGAILRLVVHSHSPAPRTSSTRAISAVGFAIGLLAALAIPAPDSVLALAQPRELSLVQSLGPLFIETAPSMLLGLLAAGLVHAFVPRQMSTWLRGGTPFTQAVRGMVFGMPLPICSCGVMPLMQRMLVAGVPAAAVVAFAIGTPELGIDSAVLSVRLLGWPLTLARIVASIFISIAVALLVARAIPSIRIRPARARKFPMGPARTVEAVNLPPPPSGTMARLGTAVREAFGPSLDHVGAWYVTGLVIAAVFEAAVDPAFAARIGAPGDIFVSALAAVPMYVCAQGATPLAAVLVHKGFSVGAAVTFLIVGPGTNLAVLGMLRRSLGSRAAAAFALGSLVCAVIVGLVANALISPASVPEIHPLVAHDHASLEWLCAGTLGAMLLASLVRLGPREWFANMAISGHDTVESSEQRAQAAHGHAH